MARVKKIARGRDLSRPKAEKFEIPAGGPHTAPASGQPAKTEKGITSSGWLRILAWPTMRILGFVTAVWRLVLRHPMILAWLAMLIFAIHASTHMVAAGDTWVAMACGRHFVNHGVDTFEPFSANSHKPGPTPQEVKTWPKWAQWITDKVGLESVKKWHPTGWVNQNWLTHVIFYWLTTTLGSEQQPYFNALVYWKFTIYILTIICVFYTGRLLGADPLLSAAFACFALFVGRSFLDIRPQGFSNLLVAVFLLVLVLAAYRNILYIWLIVPITVFWCNVHGGYIYAFIMLVPFIGLHLLTTCDKKWTAILYNVTAWPFYAVVVSRAGLTMSTFLFLVLLIVLDITLIFYKNNLVSISWRGIYHTIAAGFVAFFAMLVLNPFHLTNLTHTFVISVSEHAARWREIHEWQPAFDWGNPVGTAVPFLVMYIIAWVVLGLWIVISALARRSMSQSRSRKAAGSDESQCPKLNLPSMMIGALTIYMAIRSRRFIPVAAIAGCPIIAMFVDQIVRAISAARNFHRQKSQLSRGPFVSTMPRNVQLYLTIAGAAAVVFFGVWWGGRFKRVYLDAWPNDPELTSIFMRMTASDAKPFCAGKFIRMNKLAGNMFNYWTEGGFVAWAQEPDPNTGRTPLQLFMDGRAQAAYNRETFDLWSYIMSGGLADSQGFQIVQRASMKARMTRKDLKDVLTSADYVEIGPSIDQALTERDVWAALMPVAEFDSVFVRGLEHTRNWVVVFLDNKQKILVNYATAQGKELFDGIESGKTLYPDDFSRALTLAHNLLLYSRDVTQKRRGLDLAIQAFNLNPSPTPMLEIMVNAARFTELVLQVNSFCKSYSDSFTKNEQVYARRHGYRFRLEAARLACVHLERVARAQGDAKLAESYTTRIRGCDTERERISNEQRW